MGFIDDTIANWTPAQLQSFIQSISSVDATQIPTSLNFLASEIAAGKIDNLSVNNKLDLAAKVGISQAGVPIDEGLVASSDANNQLVFKNTQDWERVHLATGDTWAGMNYHQSVFTTAGSPNMINGRVHLQLVEVTKKMTTNGFVFNVASADSGMTYTNNGYAVYGPWTPGASSVALIKSVDNGATAGIFSSTGTVTMSFTPISFYSPGFYYVATFAKWSAGSPAALFGGTAHGLHAAHGGGSSLTRSCGYGNQTGFPATISSGNANYGNFENVFWAGAVV